MNPELPIGVGSIAAIAAALACIPAHRWARARRWGYVPRYVFGVAIGLLAFAFPLFMTLETPSAVVLLGVIVLIFSLEGLATWLMHDADPPTLTPDADRLLSRIDEELGK